MKEIIVILRPACYFKTKDALGKKRFFAMNTREVLGRGKAHVSFKSADGNAIDNEDKIYANALVAKKMMNIVVPDGQVREVIDTVLEVNSHNTEGDGKIFVIPVEESIRIHTGETGEDALV